VEEIGFSIRQSHSPLPPALMRQALEKQFMLAEKSH
jgi:hypothetical protein